MHPGKLNLAPAQQSGDLGMWTTTTGTGGTWHCMLELADDPPLQNLHRGVCAQDGRRRSVTESL